MHPLPPRMDAANSLLRRRNQPLSVFFSPKTVAVLGATESAGSMGRTVLWNLVTNPFGGTVFPVNPERTSVLGIKAYPSIAAVPEKVELAVIATPPETVPRLITECVDAGVQGAIIVSAGFKEIGPDGLRLEEQILENARRGSLRIIGPNCLGVMSPLTGLNATFAVGMARPGNVAFISQSGALCTSVLDWSLREMVGFSCFISIGSMIDVGWGDLIDYLGDDQSTRSIVMYMESIGDARSFLSAAREVALTKPIIVIKAGRTEAAVKAAASHTGALTGSDEVLDAAFRRGGVLRVNNISELFDMARVVSTVALRSFPMDLVLTKDGTAVTSQSGGVGDQADDAVGLYDVRRGGPVRYVRLADRNPLFMSVVGGEVFVMHGVARSGGVGLSVVDAAAGRTVRSGLMPDGPGNAAAVAGGRIWTLAFDEAALDATRAAPGGPAVAITVVDPSTLARHQVGYPRAGANQLVPVGDRLLVLSGARDVPAA